MVQSWKLDKDLLEKEMKRASPKEPISLLVCAWGWSDKSALCWCWCYRIRTVPEGTLVSKLTRPKSASHAIKMSKVSPLGSIHQSFWCIVPGLTARPSQSTIAAINRLVILSAGFEGAHARLSFGWPHYWIWGHSSWLIWPRLLYCSCPLYSYYKWAL